MVKGRCLCGGVTYTVNQALERAAACHCSQCRKQSGHVWAGASVRDENLTVTGEVRWFASSDIAKRGFCPNCGSSLFWKANGSDITDIGLGTVDGETGTKLLRHIFVADKGDYYEIADGLPQWDTH